VSGEGDPDEQLTPAQRSAAGHLALLRLEPPTPDTSLVRRVVRTTRWQQAVRAPLRVVTIIAGAILDALGVATRRRKPR
jgi:hypothetical protein